METFIFNSMNEKLDFYSKKENKKTLIYIHGGGLTEGDKGDIYPSVDFFLDSGLDIISINYRLFPNVEYPQFIEDVVQGISFSLKNHLLKQKVILYGVSAGAYISMMIGFNKKYKTISDLVDAFIFDSGQISVHFYLQSFYKVHPKTINEMAPIFYINDLAVSFDTPMLFISSTDDIEGRKEENVDFVEKLVKKGYKARLKIFEGYSHCKYTHTHAYNRFLIDFIKEI